MKKRPNIIIVTTHDTGRHFGCYGINTVNTPAIDSLAADGYMFSNFFCVSPVCSPSRASMLTGRYPQSNGVIGLIQHPYLWKYNEGEKHLSHILRDAGYYTALFGIQHETNEPETLGFEYRFKGTIDKRYPHCFIPAPQLMEYAVDFLRERSSLDQPFYAQIGFNETHRPYCFAHTKPDSSGGVHVPPYLKETKLTVQQLSHLQGQIKKVDEGIKVLMDGLKETGLERDTIFIFNVDHGIEFPRAKWHLYDPGIEVAMIMRWPGGNIDGGKTCDWLLSSVDVLPTLLDLIDEPIPENVEGKSFVDALKEKQGKPTQDYIFAEFENSRCIRTEKYKLIRNFSPRKWLEVPTDMSYPVYNGKMFYILELFDLEKDPNEFNNVAENPEYAETVLELSNLLWKWMEEVDDPMLKGPLCTPFYQMAVADYHQKL